MFNRLGKFETSYDHFMQFKNRPLSVEGEKRAEILSRETELQNLDAVYCSNYPRAMETAKYLSESQDLPLNVDERFDEITEGDLDSFEWDEKCDAQYSDLDLKFPNGESHNDVRKRYSEGFWQTVKEHRGKRVAIVTHGCSMSVFMLIYAELVEPVKKDHKWIKYKGHDVYHGKYNTPEVFKLTIDDDTDEILDIVNIKFDDLEKRTKDNQ